ncbi:hypothetical protein HRR83_000006 [Exophiala dermatitidis]|uniref:DUF3669 domain-containing protein n=1 Tax=Exophiala dermatitidis TaxID=5970 RepID=A0AAN6F0Y1_EXODE|nr:hypothetical protein HRR73_002539 [Exophiala dermatitidis]KAJ4524417.1 hypothetical protein HRR75_000005 [Exophiala dermatitidis]KAJ4527254.1 hypothetical protein HRR74_000006 [Exophiala dermatitidis]KAJ4530807.1 hypothetical protein HRR76_008502 [Exophiala dermatitidis]KAJ4549726.1 hypothetical protein HRR78_004535 [Exophiala dermatitidis]
MTSDSQQDSTTIRFRRIGQGFCGSVWAAEEGTMAMKREDGGPGRSLLNDYKMHELVLDAVSEKKLSVCVPRWPKFVKNDDRCWWNTNLSSFPADYTTCNVLCSERIPPLPQEVRHRLIDRYCPPASVSTIKANDADRDCLVRPYLGRRKIQNEARRGRNFFSLRNYPLHLNQAEDLGLPILEYARAMADTLAMMHWMARIDANDVEFVLGGVRTKSDSELASDHSEYIHDFLGTHSMWVLDFDCCRPMTMDDAGIDQAARAFLRNDPFFPRPTTGTEFPDSTLWTEFRNRYLESSKNIVPGSCLAYLNLPGKFIQRVVEMHEHGTDRKTSADALIS